MKHDKQQQTLTGTSITLTDIRDTENLSSPFINRLKKNYRHIKKWARRTGTDCFRIYDRDIPQYPLAVDYYAGRFSLYYYSRSKNEEGIPADLAEETEFALSSLFAVQPENFFWKTRTRRDRSTQYEKTGSGSDKFTVFEYGVPFLVNLRDYIDTGIFLDHRETRRIVSDLAPGKRVLNLFAYTGAFSVHCALKGAEFTKTVDMSNTYTAWTRDNFLLNGLNAGIHEIVRADCIKFIDSEKRSGEKYDIIIIDPPTLSRSKKMDSFFDVQLHYVELLTSCIDLLAVNGTIFFSTNSRQFRFDKDMLLQFSVTDITKKTIPIDFHDTKIHQCYRITMI